MFLKRWLALCSTCQIWNHSLWIKKKKQQKSVLERLLSMQITCEHKGDEVLLMMDKNHRKTFWKKERVQQHDALQQTSHHRWNSTTNLFLWSMPAPFDVMLASNWYCFLNWIFKSFFAKHVSPVWYYASFKLILFFKLQFKSFFAKHASPVWCYASIKLILLFNCNSLFFFFSFFWQSTPAPCVIYIKTTLFFFLN